MDECVDELFRSLIARGNERLEIGDIAAARLLFELAAQSGSR